ncbi:MAG: alpha/beta hydrolase [Bacteroidia bacterium]|nr:alpha/beta hydrolase [Bacteroidia bacterium]
MNKLLLLFLIWGISFSHAQTQVFTMDLYPGLIPNDLQMEDGEWIEKRKTGHDFIHDTSIPTLTAYLPEHPNGQAVIVCPGGGYKGTSYIKEGIHICQSLNEDSVTAFLLKYRIPQDKHHPDKSLAPLQDAQQAIRHVRSHAKKYQVEANRIGIMGFSAGGHLAASAATQFDSLADSSVRDTSSVRPDFVILIYPVISMTDELTHKGSRKYLLGKDPQPEAILRFSNELQVNKNTPPAFLVHAADDKVVTVGNSLAFYNSCLKQGVEAEMHLYPKGGHGYGLNNLTTKDRWMDRLKNWLKSI